MTKNNRRQYDFDDMPPVVNLLTLSLIFILVVAVVLFVVLAMPSLVPNLSSSLIGAQPKVFWYLSRSSAIVAFGLLWFSMVLGLTITNKMARIWPGGPVAFDLHQFTGILGLSFGLFHAMILIGDQYINFTIVQVLVPFTSVNYFPTWVGIGQLAFYLWLIVVVSFYLRCNIGTQTWRLMHYISYAVFVMALLHGINIGTDSAIPWVQKIYIFAGITVLFLTLYRIFKNLNLLERTPTQEST